MTATAQPLRYSVLDQRGASILGAKPESYPLTAICSTCGESIRCADGTADWTHVTADGYLHGDRPGRIRGGRCEPLLKVCEPTDWWPGACALTGCTMAEFAELLDGVEADWWMCRSAVRIVRAYASKQIRVVDLVEVLDAYLRGLPLSLDAELLDRYAAEAHRFTTSPQYPAEHERWMLLAAVYVCRRWSIAGVSDPWYVCNTIGGELYRLNARRTR